MLRQWRNSLVCAGGILLAPGPASAGDPQPSTTQRVTPSAAAAPSDLGPGAQPDARRAVRPKKKGIEDHGLLSVLADRPEGRAQDKPDKGSALGADLQEALQGLTAVKKPATDELLERTTDDRAPGHRRDATLDPQGANAQAPRDRRYGEGVTRWSGPREIDLRSEPLPDGARPAYGADEIKRQVRAHRDQILYCYERELSRQSTFSGQLVFSCEVGPDGRITATEVVSDTLGSESLTQCLERRVRTWTFPPPKSGRPTLARIPILF